MSAADVVAVGAFFAIVVAGFIVRALRDLARRRPAARVRSRVEALREPRAAARPAAPARASRVGLQLFTRTHGEGEGGALRAWLRARGEHVRTAAGGGGVRAIAFASALAALAGFVGASFAGFAPWLRLALAAALAAGAARAVYRILIGRFKQRFLSVFPDALDLIIRAVRAGIPVAQAIGTAGRESEEPVRATFRAMGDALRVGADLKDVLEQQAERLRLADFSFFGVCLVLQRETGGNLTETLENLSGIIRTRRDIRMKTRALTAEGRIASKIIAAVPFAIAGFLFVVNRPYVNLLFHTRAGHKMLILAAVLLTVGLAMIRKIANLDTSR
ncbi:type II secretion system (T2SS), F family protein [Burkholderia pseudomallei MSHR4377]|uniref:type II secretion system F family protein n=1 Tax=Burkholderia pseudomallei TaxID=28450 RepID=UPI00050EC99D|nr:type II secretion system F family protein [Burkholderia pseudomallei]AJX72428.1 type II secretion system (T2SS), F family protein [Burkholderia pseudomallei MSHR840]KGC51835.1 type II secretion system (T2SS), F family protein [Burkholderia pseudomallei]KGC67717.1 type II secretion system (T2SS), F family protein [Burkholderia pseudomallei]KGU95216.1 type II secretion system (T2SS), F family protein [Burkholderia pseudomallei MSHR4377]KGV91092.1 type II secretion system (T2SS), F family prot